MTGTAPMPTVIVSGLPRSGTSMLMQMLAVGGVPLLVDDSRPADPDNPRGYYELDAVKRLAADSSVLLNASGRAVKVIHRLLKHLPSGPTYAVIFLHRRIDEVVASQRAMLERLGRDGARLDPDRLVELYRGEVASAIQRASARADVRLLEIGHADVLGAPSAAAEGIAAFLRASPGWTRPLDAVAMAAAVDPLLHRQRMAPRDPSAGTGPS